MTVTAATLVADASALNKIVSGYDLVVSGGTVTAAAAVGLPGGVTSHLTAGLAISDSAAHVTSQLDALEGLGGTIASVALTDDSPVITLSAAQLLSDASVLLKVGGSYGLTLSGTATADQAANANSILVDHLTTGFAIYDTVNHVTADLGALQALASLDDLASITLSNGGTPNITVSAATVINDAMALANHRQQLQPDDLDWDDGRRAGGGSERRRVIAPHGGPDDL